MYCFLDIWLWIMSVGPWFMIKAILLLVYDQVGPWILNKFVDFVCLNITVRCLTVYLLFTKLHITIINIQHTLFILFNIQLYLYEDP